MRYLLIVALLCAIGCDDQTGTSGPGSNNGKRPTRPKIINPLAGAIDPFQPDKERVRFIIAAGPDGLLDEQDFKTDVDRKDPFIRKFDVWENLLRFDGDKNEKINWFEAIQYRRGLRQSVMTKYGTGRKDFLNRKQRSDANLDLVGGRVPLPADSPRLAFDPFSQGLTEAERKIAADYLIEDRRMVVKQFDTDADGKLDRNEHVALLQQNKADSGPAIIDLGIAHFDEDDNGLLSMDEAVAFLEFVDQLAEAKVKFEISFFDADANGTLDRQEKALLNSKSTRIKSRARSIVFSWWGAIFDGSASDAKLRVRGFDDTTRILINWITEQYDADRNGKLNAGERSAMFKGVHDDLIARHKRNDKDGNGELSFREIDALIMELGEELGLKPKEDEATDFPDGSSKSQK